MNFAACPTAVPKTDIMLGVEAALITCQDAGMTEKARGMIAGILQRAKPPPANVSKEEQAVVASLRDNKKITILPAADKGNATVILEFED